MMKKLTALLTALFLLLSATALADEVIHIGIIQFAEHGSLDNCRIGFCLLYTSPSPRDS